MQTLREALERAKEKGVSIGHFNISDSIQFEAIVESARELNVPVMIGVSEGERKWIGVTEIAALVRTEREKGLPIFLNADHTRSLEGIGEALAAGFDEVLFDGSALSFEENVATTKEVVVMAHGRSTPAVVEGELGYIGTSSEVREGIPENLQMTDPDEAARFVHETGIDLLAPAVGNIHGMMKDGTDPALDIARIRAIAQAVSVPLVLHGASGNTDEEIWQAIEAGVRIVHINTEIRAAYREGIETGLAKQPNEVAPYKFMADAKEAVKEVVVAKLRLFNHL
jgi:fructose-bisphosphate aldolase class II